MCAKLETSCQNNSAPFAFDVEHPVSRFEALQPRFDGALKGDDVDSGSAIRGQAPGGPRHTIPEHTGSNWVSSVQVAILKDRPRARIAASFCEWVGDLRGHLTRKRSNQGFCDARVWLPAKLSAPRQAKGTWRLRLRGRLPAGAYTFITRATNRFGESNEGFASRYHNLIHLTARRCAALGICRR